MKINNRIGQRFGNYSLLRLLGHGSVSEVYLGEHVESKTQAAIKILQLKLAATDQEGFLTWAHSMKQLKHPHIVSVWDAGVQENTPFLAMTYAPYGSLRTSHPPGASLPQAQVLTYVQQITAALQYLHDQKLIYRDLRPQNLLLETPNNTMLADFAFSLVSQSSRSLNMQEMMGDITYMAPEQLQGKTCAASDQYALGIIVYEWLSGDVPFHGTFTEVAKQHAFNPPPPLHATVPEIAPAIEEVVQIAISKDPQLRFANVQAFSRAFEQACQQNQPPLEARTFRVPEGVSILPNKLEDHQNVLPSRQPVALPSHDNMLPSGPQPLLTPVLSGPQLLPTPVLSGPQPLPTPVLSGPQPLPTPLPSQQPARSRRSMVRTVLLSVLALLIVASGGSLLYLALWQHSTQPVSPVAGTAQTLSLTATTQAQLHSTTVAQSDTNAEATAEAEARTEDAAAATAMQNLYTEATHGVPVINAPLRANDSNRWDENTSSKDERCAFIGGGYHVIEPQPSGVYNLSFYPCFAHTDSFSNFALQAKVTILKGDVGGLIFLADKTHTNYCYFGLDDIGAYHHHCYINGGFAWTLNSQKVAVGNKSPQVNLLTVVVRNQRVFLYVNKQYVGSMKITDFTAGGIGIAAEDFTKNTEAVFNDVQVWNL